MQQTMFEAWAVVVAQLVDRSIPTPEIAVQIQSSAKFIFNIVYYRKDKYKEKEAVNGPF